MSRPPPPPTRFAPPPQPLSGPTPSVAAARNPTIAPPPPPPTIRPTVPSTVAATAGNSASFNTSAKMTDTVMPSTSADGGNSIVVSGYRITTHKLPILNSGEIDEMTSKLGIAPPEMIFGNNCVKIEKVGSSGAAGGSTGGAAAPANAVPVADGNEGFKIEFIALDALDLVDKTGNDMLKVAYSEDWHKQRQGMQMGIKEVIKPFDWTYSTSYTGSTRSQFTETSDPIPLDKLRRPDPILFFDDVMLYEDELADNGMSMLSVKIRVMPARLLLLCRFYLRLDDVVFRVRDTRVYVEFSEGLVIREYTAREDSFANVKQKLAPYRDDIAAIMRDSSEICKLLPIVEEKRDKIVLR